MQELFSVEKKSNIWKMEAKKYSASLCLSIILVAFGFKKGSKRHIETADS